MSGAVLAPRRPWAGRRVVLGVTGGIAAYKSVQVARDLTRLGAEVDLIPGISHQEQALPVQGTLNLPVKLPGKKPMCLQRPRMGWIDNDRIKKLRLGYEIGAHVVLENRKAFIRFV